MNYKKSNSLELINSNNRLQIPAFLDSNLSKKTPRRRLSSQLVFNSILGSGAYSTVVDYTEGFVCKIIQEKNFKYGLREVYVLKQLKDIEGVAEIIDVIKPYGPYADIVPNACMNIILPKYKLTLSKWLQDKKSLNERIIICKRLLMIMFYVHQKGIVHGDIKPSNIMLSDKGYVKIIDWGLSGPVNYSVNECCTPIYSSGLNEKGYSHDIYSLGVVIYEVLNNKVISSKLTLEQIKNLDSVCKNDEELSQIKKWKEIIKHMTQDYPEIRCSLSDICVTMKLKNKKKLAIPKKKYVKSKISHTSIVKELSCNKKNMKVEKSIYNIIYEDKFKNTSKRRPSIEEISIYVGKM